MASLIVIPFLIGSVPMGLAVLGADYFLKDKKKTNKILYWGGLTASLFGGLGRFQYAYDSLYGRFGFIRRRIKIQRALHER